MTVKATIAHFRKTAQYHGWGSALELLFIQFLRKVMTVEKVLLYALEEAPSGSLLPGPDRVRLATDDELLLMMKDPSFDMSDLTEQGLAIMKAKGDRCVVNLVDGKIAGYSWLATDAIRIPKLHARVELTPTEGYIYKGFTHPTFRGLKVGSERYLFWLDYLKKMGRQRIICDFAFDNKATLTRVSRLGMTLLGTCTLIRVAGFRKQWARGEFRIRKVSPL